MVLPEIQLTLTQYNRVPQVIKKPKEIITFILIFRPFLSKPICPFLGHPFNINSKYSRIDTYWLLVIFTL